MGRRNADKALKRGMQKISRHDWDKMVTAAIDYYAVHTCNRKQ